MTDDLSALIARLEVAKAGSRELDRDLAKLADPVEWKKCANWAAMPCGASPDAIDRDALRWLPDYTASLDAALALAERVLPEATFWEMSHNAIISGVRQYYAEVFPPDHSGESTFWGLASTPALALCIATLRAKLDGYEAEGEVNKNPKAQEG